VTPGPTTTDDDTRHHSVGDRPVGGSRRRRGASVRNVVLLCLDTVRADAFADDAPRLHAMADTVFTECRAASGWSTPSHASMLAGRLPHEHGVHAHGTDFAALDRADTLFGDLPTHRALGVSANVYAGSAFGFDRLFADFVDVSRDHRYPAGLDAASFVAEREGTGLSSVTASLRAALTHDHPAMSLANTACLAADAATRDRPGVPALFDDGARTVLRESRRLIGETVEPDDASDDPFLLFCNLMESHEPHRDTLGYDRSRYTGHVPRGWSTRGLTPSDVLLGEGATGTRERDLRRFRALYTASVDYLDRRVSAFVEDLLASHPDTTVVVTADHGENLADDADRLFGHVSSLSEAVLHVPLLVINAPGDPPARVTDRVSHLALRELLAGLARGEFPDVTTDRPVAEVAGITPGNDRLLDADPNWDRTVRVAYDGAEKYCWDSAGGAAVYELDPDRPCWQRRTAGREGVVFGDSSGDESGESGEFGRSGASTGLPTLPAWVHDRFACSVEAVVGDRQAGGRAEQSETDAAVARRLRDLGYR
jgi:arylsulfatase A-like enzyme